MKPEHEVLFLGLIEYPEITAWAKGYDAFRLGEGIGACPYLQTHEPYGQDRQVQWFDGYQLGLQEEKARRMDASMTPVHFPFGIRPKK
jgi:hypothetical protein